jgi:hypothetical protein
MNDYDNGGMVDYETIRAWTDHQRGKRSSRKVADFLAMSAERDPFYAGLARRRAAAEWFAEIWHTFGIGYGTHLRRIHYRLVSVAERVRLWTGEEYENTDACWEKLGIACANARYLGLIPADAIVDHRNQRAAVYLPTESDAASVVLREERPWSVGGLHLSSWGQDFFITYPRGMQGYHLELVCEKTTMDDVLRPLCALYEAVLVTASGEVSITQIHDMAQRIVEDGRPARIFYISDFDPAGATMPVSAARKLEFFLRKWGWEEATLTPIALTEMQVQEYGIPRIPIKASDMRRGRFEERHGAGGAELDALEATQPGLLAEIVEAAFDPYFDDTLQERVADQRAALEAACWQAYEDVHAHFADRCEAITKQLDAICLSIAPQLDALTREARALGREVAAAMREAMPNAEDFPVPEVEEADEDDLPEPLYAGYRIYQDQLGYYKEFQGKGLGQDLSQGADE